MLRVRHVPPLILCWFALIPAYSAVLTPDTRIQSTTPASLQIGLSPGRTLTITVDQKDGPDLRLKILTPEGESLDYDSFEFGAEVATIACRTAGVVRITVETVAPASQPVPFTIQTKLAEPSDSEAAEMQAERHATAAKAASAAHPAADETLALAAKSREEWTQLGNTGAEARAMLEMGGLRFARSEWPVAETQFLAAERLCEPSLRCKAEAVNNAAMAELNLGEIAQVEGNLLAASSAWHSLGLREYEARSLSNLGLLYSQTSRFSEALAEYSHARDLLASSKPLFLASVLNNSGLVYLTSGDYSNAAAMFQEGRALAARFPDGAHIEGRIWLNLGRARMFQGNFASALADEQTAIGILGAAQDRSGQADALNNLGQVQFRMGRKTESENTLSSALVIFEDTQDSKGLSSALYYLGLIAASQRNLDEARALLDRSLAIREARGLLDETAATQYQIALIERRRGNRATAIDFAGKAVDNAEILRARWSAPSMRRAYFATLQQYFGCFIDLLLSSPSNSADRARAFRVADQARARTLADALSAIDKQEDSNARRSLWQQIDFQASRLASLSFSNANETESQALRAGIENLMRQDDRIAALSAPPGNSQNIDALPLVDLDNLRETLLKPGDLLMNFWLGEEKSYVWKVQRSNLTVEVLPARSLIRRDAESLIALLADHDGRHANPDRENQFQAARSQMARDLGFHFDGALPQRLILVPDGILNRVPFAVLPGGGNGRGFLGLKVPITEAPSVAVLLFLSNRRAATANRPWTAAAFADPVFSNMTDSRVLRTRDQPEAGLPLARLAFSQTEIATLESLLPAPERAVFTGFSANRTSFLDADLTRDRLVLISTHLILDDIQPELSGLVFSMVDHNGNPQDGTVRLFDLYNRGPALNGALVVLSTCDGASGHEQAGEGLLSLASAFLRNGANGVVAASAAVDAEASSSFTSSLLKALLAPEAASPERALFAARVAAARSARWSDPWYWATFRFIGGV